MKAILKTESPKSCEQIANGEKTMLLSKTRPKLETPFKGYIYCTKGKEALVTNNLVSWTGEVVGEFVCGKIEMVNAKCSSMGIDLFYHDCMKFGCLSESEINRYFGVQTDLRDMKGNGYGWHISELKIYHKPKELSDFVRIKPCENDFECPDDCPALEWKYYSTSDCKEWDTACRTNLHKPLTSPPQSYMYVKELEG